MVRAAHRAIRPFTGSCTAFTLVELVVTITLVAIVGALGTGIVVLSGRAYARSKTYQDSFSDASYALNRMALELRNVASPNHFLSISSNSISFQIAGQAYTYALSGTELLRNGQPLAAGVSSLALTYYDASNIETANPASVQRIAIALTVSRGGSSARLRTEVFPRPFRVSYISWQEQ